MVVVTCFSAGTGARPSPRTPAHGGGACRSGARHDPHIAITSLGTSWHHRLTPARPRQVARRWRAVLVRQIALPS